MNTILHVLVVSPCLFQKSKDSKKGPVVILSITYRGVKFIDAATKVRQIYGVCMYKMMCSTRILVIVWLLYAPTLLFLLSPSDHSCRAWDQEHFMCCSRPRWPLHFCIHHQGSEEWSPFLPRLQHCGSGGWSNFCPLWSSQTLAAGCFSHKSLFLHAQTQTYEIILTLGQAFEVAYQMAVQSRARQYVPPSSQGSEFVETKASRPMSQSWSSMRRSAVSICEMQWRFEHWIAKVFVKKNTNGRQKEL